MGICSNSFVKLTFFHFIIDLLVWNGLFGLVKFFLVRLMIRKIVLILASDVPKIIYVFPFIWVLAQENLQSTSQFSVLYHPQLLHYPVPIDVLFHHIHIVLEIHRKQFKADHTHCEQVRLKLIVSGGKAVCSLQLFGGRVRSEKVQGMLSCFTCPR